MAKSDFPRALDEDQQDALDDNEEHGGPDPDEELVPDDADDGDAAASADKVAEKLAIFGATLSKRRDEWVAARAAQGHDQRWGEDLRQYNGKDPGNNAASNMMESVQQGFPVTSNKATPTRSTVFVQVTRQKTNAAAARLGDILLPTDERNFSVGPTPLPSMPSFVHVTGAGGEGTGSQNPTPGNINPDPNAQLAASPIDQATQILLAEYTEAKKRGDAMQKKIEDCFDECDYNAEVRKSIFNAALFGTGVMKGPVVMHRTRRAWSKVGPDADGQFYWQMDEVEELTPASYALDPRFVYPDPLCGECVQDGRGVFEYDKKTIKGVMSLAKQPAYLKDQIKAALEQGPTVGSAMSTLDVMEDRDMVRGDLFEHWIYWGQIDREDLEAAGVKVPEDELEVVSACVEMINNVVVRAYLNPLADGALPYDFFPWERVPGSVQGYGVPYLMRSQQRVINAAWRMILDNAGVSSGPQIVIKPGAITPADKQWTLTPRKIWYATDDVDDVNKAFGTFEFPSHIADLSSIIELAERLSDAETAVPQMTQGERGSAPETVGGMQMLMNSANVVLRRLVKNFDDTITKPHVRRYYDYLMEYDTDDSLKGDFQVVALGSSSLVVRDIENQAITNMLALGTNPAYAPLINLKKLFEKALKAQHIDPVDVMNSDAEIQSNLQRAQQSQGPDPRVAAAEMRAEADKMRTQSQEKIATETLQLKQQNEERQHQREMDKLAAQERIETMRMANQQNLTYEQIRANLAAVGIKERAKADQAALDVHVQAATSGVGVGG
jgi:hypothetical protein